jgi:hypothetical protein
MENVVEPNNVEEESVCHHCCRIRVAEGDEMSVLRERVHHSVDHILVAHLGKALNEIHGDVGPHCGWHIKQLQQPNGMEMLCFVLLARCVGAHEVLHDGVCTWHKEVLAEPMQNLSHPFVVANSMDGVQHL